MERASTGWPRRPARRAAFVGLTNNANGLGEAARSYVRALHHTGCTVSLHAIERPFHVHARVAPAWQAASFAGAPDVALVHLNGDGWDAVLSDEQKHLIAAARRRVGLFVWETSFVPRSWLDVVNRLDAIWVPSEFCAGIFREIVTVPVHVIPYVVENETTSSSHTEPSGSEERFGLDPRRRTVLYAFDGSSFLARKNPHALIRTFRAAGLGDEGWQLVLKTKHVFDVPTEGQRLLELVGAGRDVIVIDEPMGKADLDALFGRADIYASSHASEGFGLTIAEAMEMGKVVVATDYGGSRDFLDASCGFPVRAETVTLSESHGPYLRGAQWGSVDEGDLARALREAASLIRDGRGPELGRAAQARVRERLSATAVARLMEESLAALDPGLAA